MSQRPTYQHGSLPGSPHSPVLGTPASRPSSAQNRHQAQLASYRRDPIKVAAASRKQHGLPRTRSNYGDYSDLARHGAEVDDRGILTSFWRRAYHIYLPSTVASLAPNKRNSRRLFLGTLLAALFFYAIQKIMPTGLLSTPPPSHGHAHVTSRSTTHNPIPKSSLPSHIVSRSHPDHVVLRGQLKVDPESKIHPIYQLIRDGREQWDAKVARQSKSLKQAVHEYKRRYKRNPPKGFDKWWDYVIEHNVQLPDEYDQIDHDVAPFFALSSKELQRRVKEESAQPDVFTIRVQNGAIRTNKMYSPEAIEGSDDRLKGQVELLEPVAQWIDDLAAVYSIHDTPSKVTSHEHMMELFERIGDHEWLDDVDQVDLTHHGWQMACPKDSPLRSIYQQSDFVNHAPALPDTSLDHKTFISDHRAMMDPCNHPLLVPLHGFLAGKDPAPNALEPRFSLSKTTLHSDIVGVPTEQYATNVTVIPWGERHGEKLLWRGSTTGAYHDAETAWWATHRCRLVALGDNSEFIGREDGVHLLLAPKLMKGFSIARTVEHYAYDELNKHYVDLAFVGEPILTECSSSDGTCDDLLDEYRWEDRMSTEDQSRYKYIIDTDGNAWSARFQRLMSTGSLIFKSTIMTEWWTDRIQPWVHYVPIQLDYSDLYDALAFFRGDLRSRGGEQDLARDIASAGREWSLTHYRKEDMTAYVFRLYLEWARLFSGRRREMDFVLDDTL